MIAKKIRTEPTTREILKILAFGVIGISVIGVALVAPGVLKLAFPLFRSYKGYREQKLMEEGIDPKVLNIRRLKQSLKRLEKQKMVEINQDCGNTIIKLTEKGKTRVLKYKIQEIKIDKAKVWDGKWRLIIYDISHLKKGRQEAFRYTLKSLGFMPLQKSAYIIPYPCQNEIEFLREYFEIGNETLFLTVDHLENEVIWRRFFNV